jgi:hypothetical protein
MTSFADAWKRASGDQGDFDPADGNYRARLIDAGAFTARTSGRDKVKLTWQIIGTEDAGRQFVDFNDIDDSNPTGIRIVREKLLLLGLPGDFEPEDIDDLDHALFNLIGADAELAVAHNNNFLNVKVTTVRTGQSDIPSDPAPPKRGGFAAAARSDDDIPF